MTSGGCDASLSCVLEGRLQALRTWCPCCAFPAPMALSLSLQGTLAGAEWCQVTVAAAGHLVIFRNALSHPFSKDTRHSVFRIVPVKSVIRRKSLTSLWTTSICLLWRQDGEAHPHPSGPQPCVLGRLTAWAGCAPLPSSPPLSSERPAPQEIRLPLSSECMGTGHTSLFPHPW